jgi:hypothetical protein
VAGFKSRCDGIRQGHGRVPGGRGHKRLAINRYDMAFVLCYNVCARKDIFFSRLPLVPAAGAAA